MWTGSNAPAWPTRPAAVAPALPITDAERALLAEWLDRAAN